MIDKKNCRLCGHQNIKIAYEGPIRGIGIDSDKHDGFRIISCPSCDVEYLDPFPAGSDSSYFDGTYWKKKTGSEDPDVEKIRRKADLEQSLWVNKIGAERFEGRSVAEVGCGSGAFLNRIKGAASVTIGIEPDPVLAATAARSGHNVYRTLEDAVKAGHRADSMVSFDTLEHVARPLDLIRSMKKMLRADGEIYVGVPNQKDFLKNLTADYLPHFYHLSHLWYFSSASLEWLFRNAGLHIKSIDYVHKYNFMNIIEWVRLGRAPGNPVSDLVDSELDLRISGWLEDRGCSSHILIRALLNDNV